MSHQLDSYFSEAPIPMKQEKEKEKVGEAQAKAAPLLTALQYWQRSHHRFPALARLARIYLCAPCTSVDSERLFSTVSHVLDEKRNRLTSDKAEKLVFVKKNMHLTQTKKKE